MMQVKVAEAKGGTVVARQGRGRLIRYESPIGTLDVVCVAGSREEMGLQYGALVGPIIQQNFSRVLTLFNPPGAPEAFGLLDFSLDFG